MLFWHDTSDDPLGVGAVRELCAEHGLEPVGHAAFDASWREADADKDGRFVIGLFEVPGRGARPT